MPLSSLSFLQPSGLLKYLFTIAVALLFLTPAQAHTRHSWFGSEEYPLRFDSWQGEGEFKGRSIFSLAQGPMGYLWVGSDLGVFRFDGKTFSRLKLEFEHNNAPLDFIWELAVIGDELWIGTNHGVIRYHLKQEQATLFQAQTNIDKEQSTSASSRNGFLSASSIRKVLEDTTGKIWIATTDGLNLYNPTDNSFKHFFNPHLETANFIKTMAIYDEQHLLIGDIRGDVFLFNTGSGTFLPFYQSPYGVNIRELLVDKQGRLWIANKSNHIDVIDLTSKAINTITLDDSASARKLAIAKNGLVAVITEAQGLYIIDEQLNILRQARADSRYNMALSSDDLSTVLIDREQNLWVGGFTEGLFRLNGQASRIWHMLPKEINQSTHALLNSEDALFVGGSNWLEIRKPVAPFDLIQRLSVPSTVYGINPALDDGYLISANDGLAHIRLQRSATGEVIGTQPLQWFKTPDNMALFATLNMPDRTFIATSNGLWYLMPGSEEIQQINYPGINNAEDINNRVIYFLLKVSDERILLGGFSGIIYELSLPDLTIREVTSTAKLVGIQTLVLSAMYYQDELFIAADGVGLIRYSLASGQHSLVAGQQGLISKDINAIELLDEQHLWLSHNGGLSKFSLATNQVVARVQQQNGLQGERFNYAASERWPDGCAGFGGINGFNYLCPDALGFVTPVTKPVVQSIEINHRPLNYQQRIARWQQDPLYSDEPIRLGYDDKHIGVNFASIQYYPNPHLSYAYRLVGLNDRWTELKSGGTGANFTTLPAGKYQLEIKAYSRLYPEQQALTVMPLVVSPAWWASPVAVTLYIIGIFLSGVGGVMIRVKNIRKQNQKLQQIVSEKTTKLIRQNTEIQRIAEDNKNLLQQKDQLLSMISHEMKTPLAVMQGVTQGLLTPNLSVTQRQEIHDLLLSNIQRLNSFVKHILMLAKIRQNKQVSFKSVPFSSLVRVMLQSVERLACERKQELRSYIPYEICLRGSCFELEIMVLNLVKNAIIHSGEHSTIAVTLKVETGKLLLEIKDNGKGMDAERLNRLFQRFAASHHDMDISTGLGLALVKEIVTIHNGEIQVKSAPGQGTSVCVTLPSASITEQILHYESSSAISMETDSIPDNGDDDEAEHISKPVLLIADDEPDMLRVLNMQLGEEYHLHFVTHGKAALEFMEQNLPDVILLDYSMPGMNGLEVTAELRARPDTRLIPIVLFSASNDEALKREAMQKGVDVFVEKPFDYLWLKSVIDNAWYRRMQILNALSESASYAVPESSEQMQARSGVNSDGDQINQTEDNQTAFKKRLELVLKQHLRDAGFGAQELSDAMFMTPRTLQRKIKQLAKTSPQNYLFKQRCELAKSFINKGDTVEMAADKAGFSGAAQMRRWFKKLYGETPGAR